MDLMNQIDLLPLVMCAQRAKSEMGKMCASSITDDTLDIAGVLTEEAFERRYG